MLTFGRSTKIFSINRKIEEEILRIGKKRNKALTETTFRQNFFLFSQIWVNGYFSVPE